MTRQQFRRAALTGARWTIASRVALQLFTWPITIVVMRLLEPADYGLFALALVVSGFLALFAELGLGVTLVQSQEASVQQQRAACTLILALNVSIALLLVLLAPLVAHGFSESDLQPIVRVLALDLLFSAVASVPQAMLERNLRFRELSIAQIAAGVMGSIATVTGALWGAGTWSLVAGLLVQGAVRSALLIRFHGQMVWPGAIDRAIVQPMVRISGHVLSARLLWYWYGQSDLVMLGRLLHASLLGHYSVAAQLAMLPASKAMEAVNRVAFPILSRLQSDGEALAVVYRRLIALLALYGFGVCWGLAAVADEFVEVLLGPKWASAAWVLTCLSLVAPLRMICSLHNTLSTARGRPEAATQELLLASVLIPAAIALGAWSDGLLGAAFAWPLAYPVVYLASNLLTSRAVGVGWWAGPSVLLAPACAGLTMLGIVWVAGDLLEDAGVGAPARLVLEIVIGGASYVGVLWLAARSLMREAAGLLRELLGRKPADPDAAPL